jgi:hypothetical protein
VGRSSLLIIPRRSHGTHDAQVQEASRSMVRGKSLKKGPSEMAGIAFVSEGVANQVDCRATMVADLTTKTKPPPSGRSIFLTKRKCLGI